MHVPDMCYRELEKIKHILMLSWNQFLKLLQMHSCLCYLRIKEFPKILYLIQFELKEFQEYYSKVKILEISKLLYEFKLSYLDTEDIYKTR